MECSFSADNNRAVRVVVVLGKKNGTIKAISSHVQTIKNVLLCIAKFITQLNNLASGTQEAFVTVELKKYPLREF